MARLLRLPRSVADVAQSQWRNPGSREAGSVTEKKEKKKNQIKLLMIFRSYVGQ